MSSVHRSTGFSVVAAPIASQGGGAELRFAGELMASYRLYCLDGAGHISMAEWIEAATDEEALARAKVLKNGALRCEVWDGNRLVGSLLQDDLSPKPLTS
jgi:hypothetical protein